MKQLVFIGGQERPVLFGRNALSDIEKVLGGSLLDGTAKIESVGGVIAVVYSGLKWGLYKEETGIEPKPKFTLVTVGDWCEDMSADSPVKKIMEMFLESINPKTKNAVAGESPA
jgi:hypothetical protein